MCVRSKRASLALAAATFGAMLPLTVFASQPGMDDGAGTGDGARLDVGFLVEGGQINAPPLPVDGNGEVFQDGSVVSAEDVLGALRAQPTADRPQGKFRNATLLLSVESGDGKVSTRETAAFCRDLDLYSEPATPSLMKASCDGAVFEYAVMGNGISFLRDGQEIGSFELENGFYLINGAISRIPALR